MRLRWKQPRVRLSWVLTLLLLSTGTALLCYLHFVQDDEWEPAVQDVLPPVAGVPLPRGGRETAADEDSARARLNTKYDGPFPDSRIHEGIQSVLVDYHNLTQAKLDAARTGRGEQGRPAKVPVSAVLSQEEKRLYYSNGFNGLLSDNIALDRALADIRHPGCARIKYYKDLPTVSVVVPFFEEQLSALQRTVVSVINRSPKHLLKEIILVDDGSTTREDLNGPLESWLQYNAPLARVVRLPEREGLIRARLAGAQEAVGDVIVVLDSHCEVMTNWLPPLLNPIVENYRTAVCPLIDVISWDTFAYRPQDNGARGAFDWNFYYKRIPLTPEQAKALPEPFPNPVMNGGLFAISRVFFWELGGYDPGIAIWGGEQYNLSFKVWQCGGRLLDAPCSRVGHVFRGHPAKRPVSKVVNFLPKNYKRVAEVWMDEYAEALYIKNPSLRKIAAGSTAAEKAIREKLQCKPFKWFLETVAPDLLRVYPPFEDPDFANGTITNVENKMCLDTGGRSTGAVIQHPCHGGSSQEFHWCWRHIIRLPGDQFCLEATSRSGGPSLYNCHNADTPQHQKWTYNPHTRLLQEQSHMTCLEATSNKDLTLAACDAGNAKQQWLFQHVNLDRIAKVFPALQ